MRGKKNTVHISWYIAACACGVLLGIALAPYVTHSFTSTQLLIGGVATFAFSCIKRLRALLLIAVFSGFCFGLARATSELQARNSYATIFETSVTIMGTVRQDVTTKNNGNTHVVLKDIQIQNVSYPGAVWVRTRDTVRIRRSDRVVVKGFAIEGFGSFLLALYHAQIVSLAPDKNDTGRRIRDWFANGVSVAISQPQAALGNGFLLGQQYDLPEELEQNLRVVGLTHIVVASGYNLTILVRFARRRFIKISKFAAAVGAGGMILGFVSLTGLSPSMTRAGLVTGLSLVAWYYGRSIRPFVLLLIAAGVTALVQPTYVWGDLGWYLSFAAFTGIIIVAPLLQHYFWGTKKPGFIRQLVVEAIAAQALTVPIIAYSFGQYAPLAIPANLLVLPLIPFTMALTAIGGLAEVVAPTIAPTFGAPASGVISYILYVTEKLASIPVAKAEVRVGTSFLIVSYAIIALFCAYLYRATRHDFEQDNIVL